jgi:hypothetical protein
MTTSSALLGNNAGKTNLLGIYQWLQAQSARLGITLVLYPDKAHMEGFYLYIPAYLPEGKDAYDYAVRLQALEDSWNDQLPPPDPPINLTPAKSPEQYAVWQRLWEARDHKTEAANAVAEAKNESEQQTALAELRTARREEVQAEEEYNTFYIPH